MKRLKNIPLVLLLETVSVRAILSIPFWF